MGNDEVLERRLGPHGRNILWVPFWEVTSSALFFSFLLTSQFLNDILGTITTDDIEKNHISHVWWFSELNYQRRIDVEAWAIVILDVRNEDMTKKILDDDGIIFLMLSVL
jgi:aromatic ring-cleaving dioxygenase